MYLTFSPALAFFFPFLWSAGVQGLRLQDHGRPGQAGLPHEAGCAHQRPRAGAGQAGGHTGREGAQEGNREVRMRAGLCYLLVLVLWGIAAGAPLRSVWVLLPRAGCERQGLANWQHALRAAAEGVTVMLLLEFGPGVHRGRALHRGQAAAASLQPLKSAVSGSWSSGGQRRGCQQQAAKSISQWRPRLAQAVVQLQRWVGS